MYWTELVEEITVENVTEKINAKIEEMEKNKIHQKSSMAGFPQKHDPLHVFLCQPWNA